jgi:hypothetical protein
LDEHRLRVLENRVLRSIFGPKRDEVTGGWRKLHNEELHNLYSSPSIIRMIKSKRMRWEGHVARMGEKRNPYRILVGKPEGKRPLGRPRLSLSHFTTDSQSVCLSWCRAPSGANDQIRRCVDNIKMDLRETGWDGRDWIDLAQDRGQWRALVIAVINLRVP